MKWHLWLLNSKLWTCCSLKFRSNLEIVRSLRLWKFNQLSLSKMHRFQTLASLKFRLRLTELHRICTRKSSNLWKVLKYLHFQKKELVFKLLKTKRRTSNQSYLSHPDLWIQVLKVFRALRVMVRELRVKKKLHWENLKNRYLSQIPS